MADRYSYRLGARRSLHPSHHRWSYWVWRRPCRCTTVALLAIAFAVFLVSRYSFFSSSPKSSSVHVLRRSWPEERFTGPLRIPVKSNRDRELQPVRKLSDKAQVAMDVNGSGRVNDQSNRQEINGEVHAPESTVGTSNTGEGGKPDVQEDEGGVHAPESTVGTRNRSKDGKPDVQEDEGKVHAPKNTVGTRNRSKDGNPDVQEDEGKVHAPENTVGTRNRSKDGKPDVQEDEGKVHAPKNTVGTRNRSKDGNPDVQEDEGKVHAPENTVGTRNRSKDGKPDVQEDEGKVHAPENTVGTRNRSKDGKPDVQEDEGKVHAPKNTVGTRNRSKDGNPDVQEDEGKVHAPENTVGTRNRSKDGKPDVQEDEGKVHAPKNMVDTSNAGDAVHVSGAQGHNESADAGTLETHTLNMDNRSDANGLRDNLGRAHVQGGEGRLRQGLTTGADLEKRDAVKKMMVHAWSSYVQHAWGSDELDPRLKQGSSSAIFGFANIGATIVDSLDTLHVMGLVKEFDVAREWVAHHLNFNQSRQSVSVFEFNIRFLGGLLSAFALTGDEVFKIKAVDLAKRLLPAFNSESGIPCNLVNLNPSQSSQLSCTDATSLARLGTFSLEWTYLSNITGDPLYYDKVKRISNHMQSLRPPHGIPPDRVSVRTGEFVSAHVTLGAPGDSFFEYLIKSWLMTGKQDTPSAEMYFKAIEGFETRLLKTTSDGLKYFAQQTGDNEPIHKMDHLACFSAGMFALTAVSVEEEEVQKRKHFMQLARDIATTCHESYIRTATHIGPEVLVFSPNNTFIPSSNPSYLLRPETVESYFYMWRATHDPQYREWGWDVVQAIEKHCRLESGYIGLGSVYEDPAPTESVQQSYFLAETLKYLYLLFSDDTVLPLDQWVFNTEGHPLPLLGTTPS